MAAAVFAQTEKSQNSTRLTPERRSFSVAACVVFGLYDRELNSLPQIFGVESQSKITANLFRVGDEQTTARQ
jgi:hypothetical protein